MAALKYLSEFYTCKAKIAGAGTPVAGPGSALEQQIHAHVLAGNQAFYAGKYSAALNAYLTAWGLLPRTFYTPWRDVAVVADPGLLLGVDMTAQLTAASAQIMKYRSALGGDVPISPVVDPPAALVRLNQPYLGENAKAAEFHHQGLVFLQSGETAQARAKGEELLRAAGEDPAAQADAYTLLGAVDVAEGNFGSAQKRMSAAQKLFEKAGQPAGSAAAQHNTAVALTKAGRADDAGKLFAGAATRAPRALGWSVTHTANPGISAVSRAFGEQALPMMLRDADGAWTEIPTASGVQAKTSATVITASGAVQLNLTIGSADIEGKLLQPRVGATTLAALETYYWQLPQFTTYLTHVGCFILPVALGDTYAALGDHQKAIDFYLKARDYAYLNQAIERPMLWRKIAQIRLDRGNRLYRDRDAAGAKAEYEQIVKIDPAGGFQFAGALYEGGFAPYAAEHLAFLESVDRRAFTSIEYSRRALILEAVSRLTQIANNINYLGFPEDYVPIHSWRYLQNVARYFANQAIQSERAYITFKESAEREEFTRLALEQAVDAQRAALEVEELRVKAADEQLEAAELARNQAALRLQNAKDQRNQLASITSQLASLDEIIAFTNATGLGSDIVISSDWAKLLGIAAGTYDPAILIQLLTRARSRLTREYELANLDRQIAEMTAALAVADQQVEVGEAMLQLANQQLELAELKVEQSQAQLDHFNAQEFTPELWDNLAQAQREISRRYLDWAISAAFLMERAFEYDYDTEVNRIRFDYSRSELNGLLAADYLLADIDSFTFDRIMETEKQLPIKVAVALADRYPSQFRGFQRTGRIDFEVLLADVDQLHPGTCVRKLKRVEVVVEGLVGPRGLHGTLSNPGVSHDRGRDGARKTRVQKPETMVLSQFDLRHDGFVFGGEEEVLALFENAGPASGWILDFPPGANDVDYRAITNVHLVLYYDAFYSPTAADFVRAELAATAIYQGTLGLSLRHQYPDEFFAFRDSGEVACTIDNAYLPFNHAAAKVRDAYLVVETAAGVSHAGLVVRVATADGGFQADQTTDANGMIASGNGTEPLNGLRGLPVQDTWRITIDESANAAAFAAGFAWDKVANMYLFLDYEYAPRGARAVADDFAADPMANFEVVDDPQALTSAPSAWSYDAANQQIVQASDIHDPAGNANLNAAPDKPGTYLLRKVDTDWPALADLVLRCRVNSNDDDGIGVVFRYQDPANFYYLLMDSQRHYRRIGKKVNGAFQDLQSPALDAGNGFAVNQDVELAVAVSGSAFKAYLDGEEILSGQDDSIQAPGRVGLYSWGNTGARFLDLKIEAI